MEKSTLIKFMNKILTQNISQYNALSMLSELENVLRNQQCIKLADIVKKTINSLPEIQESTKKNGFSFEQLEIDYRRAEERKRREEAASQYSRC